MEEFKRAKLEIVVPTYNRPACVADMMEKYAEYLSRGLDFSVSVWDSSTDDETEKIMRGYISERVRYIRKPSDTDVDEKTVMCLLEVVGDYGCLCGDGYTMVVDNVLAEISKTENSAIYALYDKKLSSGKKWILKQTDLLEYSDKNKFMADNYWHITFYGSSVCSRDLLQRIKIDEILSEFSHCNLIYPSTLATCISEEDHFVASSGDFLVTNKGKNAPGWVNNKSAMRIWTKSLCETVDKLRNKLSETACNDIISTLGKRSGMLTSKGLMIFRETDNYNLKLLKKYKPYFKRVKACSMFTAYMIALMPKWLCKSIHKTYRKLKGLDKKEKDA